MFKFNFNKNTATEQLRELMKVNLKDAEFEAKMYSVINKYY